MSQSTFQPGQTASGVAASLGMTPEQFLSYNPHLAATGLPNDYRGLTGLVQVGQQYNTGPSQSQPVVTSGQSRTNTANNLSVYDRAIANLGPQDNTPTTPPAAGADPIISGLQTLQTNADAVTKSMIASTMAQYQNQKNTAEKQGENYRLGLESLGIKTGAAQTTPDILSGHIQAAANDTLAKISSINNDMNKALLDIQSAKAENDFKRIQMATDRYQQLEKNKRDAITAMHDDILFGQKQLTYSAPALLESFNTLTSDTDKTNYINEIAKRDGVSPMDVIAAIKGAQADANKTALEAENTKSLIASRGAGSSSTGGYNDSTGTLLSTKGKTIKPAFSGESLPLDENTATALEDAGVQAEDIVLLQKYLNQGYSLNQIAQYRDIPADIYNAILPYISKTKVGSAL